MNESILDWIPELNPFKELNNKKDVTGPLFPFVKKIVFYKGNFSDEYASMVFGLEDRQ